MKAYKKVKDLKNDLPFTLSKRNVECAIRKDENRCAWAEAIVAGNPGIDWVKVKNSVVHIAWADGSVNRGLLSWQMRRAVRAFDGEIPGKEFTDFCPPGTYQILAPTGRLTMKAVRDRTRKRRAKAPLSSGNKNGARTGYKVSARNQFARSSAEKFREATLAAKTGTRT